MASVVAEITVSLDGFVAGPNDGPELGLGEGGEQLHEWVYGLKSWREPHGLEGGETGPDADLLEESFNRAGAIIVGRRMFDNARGWGDEPPFRMPVFVLTHEDREPEEKQGGTTFTFVNGIENALEQARVAAGGKDVSIGGGADTIRQCLAAGLLEELLLHVAPLLLGGGVRLFEGISQDVQLEQTEVISSPAVTHLRFRVATSR
jgi:dihydrofolate reductase